MGRKIARWRRVAGETFSSWNDHDAWTQSAALAFYTLFSLAPVLIVAISVSGFVFGRDVVRGRVVEQFGELMGSAAGQAVQGILEKAAASFSGGITGILGGATLLFGATAVFIQLQSALNVVWEVKPRPGHVLRTLLTKRLLSFALVLAIGFLLLVSLILSAALNAFQDYVRLRLSAPPAVLEGMNLLFSFGLFTFLFAMIYRILPDVEIPWRDVWLGALVTSALFSIGKFLIGLYLGRTAVASAYGAAGSVVIIVLWVYYTSLIVLLGAEFTRMYSRHFLGSRREASPGAKRVHLEEVPGARRPDLPATASGRAKGPPARRQG
jgi:membrane protein